MAVTLYCTQNDLVNRLSVDGVLYRVDDDPPTALGDVLTDAATVIDEYCRLAYDPANLAASDWVRMRATDIAAYLLCERRGNPPPPGIAQQYERTLERLERVRLGTLQIPDAPQRRDCVPVMSNVRIRLDPFPRTVVERNRSTSRNQPRDYTQHTDSQDFFDYSI